MRMPPFKPASAAMASFAMPTLDQFQRKRTTLRTRYWRRILRDIARPCGLPPLPPLGDITHCKLGPLLIARSKTTATVAGGTSDAGGTDTHPASAPAKTKARIARPRIWTISASTRG